MKIAIIGCGYVGSSLAQILKGMGHSVTVTTRSHDKVAALQKISDAVCILEGNDLDRMQNLLQHLDAIVISVAADSQKTYRTTYQETAETIAQAMTSAPQLKQIIYTSSTSVYGDHQGRTVDESTPAMAVHETSQILLATEKILLGLSNAERPVCVLRLGEIYGPNREIADRLREMYGRSLPGDGSSVTNLSHLDQIVRGIVFALEGRLDGVYNLCNDEHVSRKALYAKICEEEGLEEIKWNPTQVSIHSGNKLVSSEKIKSKGFRF